jgi:hypothetical protein
VDEGGARRDFEKEFGRTSKQNCSDESLIEWLGKLRLLSIERKFPRTYPFSRLLPAMEDKEVISQV